jgi:hypothetical protein
VAKVETGGDTTADRMRETEAVSGGK